MSEKEEKELRVEAYKIAMREFLAEEKKAVYQTIGQWAFNTIAISIVIALGYFMLKMNGWKN